MDELIECKNCNTYRESFYFRKSKFNNKWYYSKSKCKVCLSKKGKTIFIDKKLEKRKPKNKLTSECIDFLNRIYTQRGYIDYIDAFRLADHHINTFGYIETNLKIEEDLIQMYNDLLNLRRDQLK